MVAVGAAGQAYDGSSGIHVPVRSAQTGEGGDDIDSGRVLDLGGEVFGVRRAVHKVKLIAEPLYDSTSYEHGTFQCVLHFVRAGCCDGGDKAVLAVDEVGSGVHQREASGAIGVLCLALFETGLAEQSALLVSRNSGNGNVVACKIHVSVDLAG